ncbi:MAG: NADH-quinone oxidoreductase subunit NuoF [Anaerovoracaceae bacterium]
MGQIREKTLESLGSRDGAVHQGEDKIHILTCCGTGCTSSGSLKIRAKLEELISRDNMEQKVEMIKTGCFGLCAEGPIMVVQPHNIMYTNVQPEDMEEIWSEHIKKGNIVDRLVSKNQEDFFSKQMRIALRNCGRINPESIDEYIAFGGYEALGKVLTKMEPEDVIEEIKESGLRGRGGGGFPVGRKWESSAIVQEKEKYICCNADEGDPGAFMDRSILEGDPHSVIEAMIIAGYAVGATRGFVYVRAEYPIAVERLSLAIDQAREYGLLGNNILQKGLEFDIEIRLGAGAFVCGEGTALMISIEGNRGEPRTKPPHSARKGLFGRPTVLNNVETLANVPQIIINGADWYNAIGTVKSKGTKVFALGGKINNTGLVEIPMGTTLREIVYDIGGGIPNGKEFKAAQTGGPSGGCIPATYLDNPMDFESLIRLGSMMGSGGLIIMDEDTCMVDIAKFFLEFTVEESCGKCPPCRIGTKRMLQILTNITEGTGTIEDLDELESLADTIKRGSLCGLGQSAPNPVLSTLQYFKDEYIAHVVDKKCPAGVCISMLRYVILEETCKRCGVCKKNCPVGCISGDKDTPYTIDNEKCIKCGVCMAKCPFKSIMKNA